MCLQTKPVSLSVLQHIRSRLAPRAPFRLLGYSFGGLLAMELALQLEAEGRKGRLYLVDSAPDFIKKTVKQKRGSNEDEFQTGLICAMFIGIAPHEATSAALSKVNHERNVKSYEYLNVLSLGLWSFKFVVLTHRPVGSFHSISQLYSWSCYNYVVCNTLVSYKLHVKNTILNINPSTNVQNSDTVTYFYASLFMTLTGHRHSAFHS